MSSLLVFSHCEFYANTWLAFPRDIRSGRHSSQRAEIQRNAAPQEIPARIMSTQGKDMKCDQLIAVISESCVHLQCWPLITALCGAHASRIGHCHSQRSYFYFCLFAMRRRNAVPLRHTSFSHCVSLRTFVQRNEQFRKLSQVNDWRQKQLNENNNFSPGSCCRDSSNSESELFQWNDIDSAAKSSTLAIELSLQNLCYASNLRVLAIELCNRCSTSTATEKEMRKDFKLPESAAWKANRMHFNMLSTVRIQSAFSVRLCHSNGRPRASERGDREKTIKSYKTAKTIHPTVVVLAWILQQNRESNTKLHSLIIVCYLCVRFSLLLLLPSIWISEQRNFHSLEMFAVNAHRLQ